MSTKKSESRKINNCLKSINTIVPTSPNQKSARIGSNDKFYFKKHEQAQLIETKSVRSLLLKQNSQQNLLREAGLKIQGYKQTIEFLEETIHDLDKLNEQLISQSKQYSKRLQQFTVKANQELLQKNQMISNLKCQLKKYENENNFSQKNIKSLLQQKRDHNKLQQQLNKKTTQYQNLLKNYCLLQKEKNEQIAYYDQVIQEKEQTIIKMTQFNNELCMKLYDRKNQETQYTDIDCFSQNNFDVVKNFNLMKEKLFQLLTQKEQFVRQIDSKNQRINELEEMYSKSISMIHTLNNQNTNLQNPQNNPIDLFLLKSKSQTSSSRSQDYDGQQINDIRNKVSSNHSQPNLLKNQFTFSEHMKLKNPVQQQENNKNEMSRNQSKQIFVQDLLSQQWSYDDSIN